MVLLFYLLLIVNYGDINYIFCFFIVKDCGFFIVLLNGFIVGCDIIFLNKVMLSCDEGFFLNGLKIRCC